MEIRDRRLERPVQGQGSRLVTLVRQGRTEDESITVHEGRSSAYIFIRPPCLPVRERERKIGRQGEGERERPGGRQRRRRERGGRRIDEDREREWRGEAERKKKSAMRGEDGKRWGGDEEAARGER